MRQKTVIKQKKHAHPHARTHTHTHTHTHTYTTTHSLMAKEEMSRMMMMKRTMTTTRMMKRARDPSAEGLMRMCVCLSVSLVCSVCKKYLFPPSALAPVGLHVRTRAHTHTSVICVSLVCSVCGRCDSCV